MLTVVLQTLIVPLELAHGLLTGRSFREDEIGH